MKAYIFTKFTIESLNFIHNSFDKFFEARNFNKKTNSVHWMGAPFIGAGTVLYF